MAVRRRRLILRWQSNNMRSPFRLLWVARNVLLTIAVVALAVVVTDPALGWFLPAAVVGSFLMAAALLAIRSPRRRATSSSDSVERRTLAGDMMDISRVQVAGVGGAGLLLIAALVALQFQLVSVVLFAGAAGGVLTGLTMILYRRRHGGVSATLDPNTPSILITPAR
jgi:hypothetical protein